MAETLPPLSFDGLLADLDNPSYTAYAYIGDEGDDGWAVALAAQKMIPNVRVFRVGPAFAAQVRAGFDSDATIVGIVFGFGRDVLDRFDRAEAQDALTVFNAIWDSGD